MKPKRESIILWCKTGLGANKLRTLHWSKRYKLDKDIKAAIGYQVAAEAAYDPRVRIDPKHPVKRMVAVTRYYGGKSREMDVDNLATACKPAIDALKMNKGSGVIVDDTPEWIEVRYAQEKTALPSWQGMLKLEVYL
jgi:hypothetical protein